MVYFVVAVNYFVIRCFKAKPTPPSFDMTPR